MTNGQMDLQKELLAKHAFDTTFQSEMHHIQQSLNIADGRMSQLVHSGPLESFGSGLNNIVLRPLSLFMGGLFALLSAAFVTFIATNDGFAVNYTTVAICLIVGWVLGTVVDIIRRS